MNLLTIIVIVIFALFALRGYRIGLIKGLASMVSLILSIVLVNFATPYVTEFLKTQTPVYDYILEKCESAFDVDTGGAYTDSKTSGSGKEYATAGQAGSGADGKTETTEKNRQEQMIDALKLPEVLSNLLKDNNTPESYAKLAVNSFADYVPGYMAGLILNICSFAVTLLLVLSFVWLAVMTLDAVAALPVIRGINQILGLALGLAQGLIIVWIAFLIITIFSQSNVGKQLMDMIVESPILSEIYDTNILLDFLQNIALKIMGN